MPRHRPVRTCLTGACGVRAGRTGAFAEHGRVEGTKEVRAGGLADCMLGPPFLIFVVQAALLWSRCWACGERDRRPLRAAKPVKE